MLVMLIKLYGYEMFDRNYENVFGKIILKRVSNIYQKLLFNPFLQNHISSLNIIRFVTIILIMFITINEIFIFFLGKIHLYYFICNQMFFFFSKKTF